MRLLRVESFMVRFLFFNSGSPGNRTQRGLSISQAWTTSPRLPQSARTFHAPLVTRVGVEPDLIGLKDR